MPRRKGPGTIHQGDIWRFELAALDIPKAQLRDFVNRLNGERMREIRSAVEFAFGFDLLD